jgi:hypothetical protein
MEEGIGGCMRNSAFALLIIVKGSDLERLCDLRGLVKNEMVIGAFDIFVRQEFRPDSLGPETASARKSGRCASKSSLANDCTADDITQSNPARPNSLISGTDDSAGAYRQPFLLQ